MGGRGSGRKADPSRVAEMARLREEGLTLAEIGRRVGMTAEGVRQALKPMVKRPYRCAVCHGNSGRETLCAECQRTGGRTPGERLRVHRIMAGLTVEQLAERAEVAVGTVRSLETDKRKRPPRPGTLASLLEALRLREL